MSKQPKEGTQVMKKMMLGIALAAVATGCVSKYRNDGGDANLRPTIVRDVAYEKYDISDRAVSSVDQRIGIAIPVLSLFTGRIIVGGLAGHFADNVDQGWAPYETAMWAKNGAYAAACEKEGCDSIVGARYDVEYINYFFWDQAKVTITGYPAKFTGIEFHKANPDKCCCK